MHFDYTPFKAKKPFFSTKRSKKDKKESPSMTRISSNACIQQSAQDHEVVQAWKRLARQPFVYRLRRFKSHRPLDIFYLVSVILQQLFDSFSGFFLLNRQTNWIHTLPPFQTSGICPLFSILFLRIRYTIPSSARYKRLFSRVPVKNGRLFPQK